jgi:hypothetical protein
MTVPSDFAAFILTNRRAEIVHTYRSLRSQGYTGRIVLLVDDEDPQRQRYEELYGEQVYVFDKRAAVAATDAGDNTGAANSVVFARNASFEIARKLGVRIMLQLDDDYTWWSHVRWHATDIAGGFVKTEHTAKDLDSVFNAVVEFMDKTPLAKILTLAQGGDFIGGNGNDIHQCGFTKPLKRKAMNTFFIRTDNPVEFVGRGNDDVNMYLTHGMRGDVFVLLAAFKAQQQPTQQQTGGLTDMYLSLGTYVKSFYSVMMAPSCVTITTMGNKFRRLHHRIDWGRAVPKIIDEKYRKQPAS